MSPATSTSAAAARPQPLERILSEYESAVAHLTEPAPVRAARARSAQELARLGWPSTRDEQWRYANLRAFEATGSYAPVEAALVRLPWSAADLAELSLPPALAGFERLLVIDGVRQDGAAAPAVTAPGPLAPLWPPGARLGLLCDLFATETVTLDVQQEAAIEVLFVSSERIAGRACYPRLDVRLHPGARLQLVERHLGAPSSATLVACNLRVELGRGADLTHYRLQQCGLQLAIADSLDAQLGQDSRYVVRQVATGARSARTSAQVRLAGREASLEWHAIAVGRGEQVHDLALQVTHAAPATRTEELYRGIADERARLACSAHVRIETAAPGSQARQSLRGLIEGGSAQVDLGPRLEISIDDVQATHGATTGQLDENLLFYLLARGIDRQTARALLKWAFLGDVLRGIELPALRAEAERLAAGQLHDALPAGAHA